MLNPASPLARLLDGPLRPGCVRWIGLRPARRVAMRSVGLAMLDPEDGLLGDRYSSRTGGARQVTVIQAEHLTAIAAFLALDSIAPERLRRNILVSGLNLLALKGRRFRLGAALLEMTGECHPCSRMEEEFGPGGYNAVRGHGGITARVIEGGAVLLGNVVMRVDQD